MPGLVLLVKTKEIYPSHDGLFHVQRINEFNESISRGLFPPRIAPILYDSIGYPLFVANYQLPYYISFIPMSLTNDPIFSYKIVIGICYLLSSIFAFFLFKNLGSNFSSLVGTILYSYAPYRFANMYTRGAFGEFIALTFVPAVLLAFHLIKGGSRWGAVFLVISFFGLITSHVILFYIYIPFFIFYCILFIKCDFRFIKKVLLSLVFAILLSSFQILPIIYERKFLRLEETFLSVYKDHFLNLFQILRIPINEVHLGTPFQIGLPLTIVFVMAFIYSIVKKSYKTLLIVISLVFYVLLITPQAKNIWDSLNFLHYVIFPWRFLSLIVILGAILSVLVLDKIRLRLVFGFTLILLAIVTSRHYFLTPTQIFSTTPPDVPTSPNEYDTIWTNDITYSKLPLIFSSPETMLNIYSSGGPNISFESISSMDTNVVVRRLFFPGWIVTINGRAVETFPYFGLISFNVPSGISKIDVSFNESKIRGFADFITLVSLFFFTLWIVRIKTKVKLS
ncbi:MAG: 6-pyruvoyl-tetrahydropterin synthase-related protein [Candidatus Curtissbacteria bacterium]|nr:6-pyruvoyl-tetrahydropterin synthase-related protein [Candidatus Curtissbacteria bacterium]